MPPPRQACSPIGASNVVQPSAGASRARSMIRPRSQRLVDWNAGPGARRVVRDGAAAGGMSMPSAAARHHGPARARSAIGPARPAERRADVHERVRPRRRRDSPARRRRQAPGGRLRGIAADVPAHDPTQNPPHVRVDRRRRGGRRRSQPRRAPCTDRSPGRRVQRRRRSSGNRPANSVYNRLRRALQVERPPVVAEATPCAEHVRRRGRRPGPRTRREPARGTPSTPARPARPASAGPSPRRRAPRTGRSCRGSSAGDRDASYQSRIAAWNGASADGRSMRALWMRRRPWAGTRREPITGSSAHGRPALDARYHGMVSALEPRDQPGTARCDSDARDQDRDEHEVGPERVARDLHPDARGPRRPRRTRAKIAATTA